LNPWFEFRRTLRSCGDDLFIGVIDARFEEWEGTEPHSTDGSLELLLNMRSVGLLDFVSEASPGRKEHETRNPGMKELLDRGVDFFVTWGADEVATPDQLERIFKFVRKEEFIAWFSLQYRNFVFDDRHFILGFNPPRIFRTKLETCYLEQFDWDDDPAYADGKVRMSYKHFSHKLVPGVLVDHFTWNDLERSKAKIRYQQKHFGHCGFRVEENGSIGFDPAYYSKISQPFPKVLELNG
jgi:hypothetical protein